MPSDLSNHHRDTLEKIFRHPASGNIDWRQVISLLDAVGTAVEEHNGNVKVTLGADRSVSSTARKGHRRANGCRPQAHADPSEALAG